MQRFWGFRESGRFRIYFIFTLLSLAFSGWVGIPPFDTTPVAAATYQGPPVEWAATTPEKEGMDSDALSHLIKQVRQGFYGPVHNLLIVHNGKLVLEKYFRGRRRNTAHTLQSETKSVTSLLIGIALAQHKIKSVDTPLLDLLPRQYRKMAHLDEAKRAITLENLLSMTAGFDWDESTYPYSDRRNYRSRMRRSRDEIRFVLDRPMTWEPGTRFTYNSGCSMLLSVILKEKTGLYADEFARRYLFQPLGFKNYRWRKDRQGYPDTSGGLYVRPRDIAKIGLLMLQGGQWKGRRIVPAEWVNQVVQPYRLKTGQRIRYGYQWWLAGPSLQLDECDAGYCMKGYQGQYLLVLPDQDLVVASNAWGSSDDQERALFTEVLEAMNQPSEKRMIVKRQTLRFDWGVTPFPGQAATAMDNDLAGLVKSGNVTALGAAELIPNLVPNRSKSSQTRRKTNEKWRIDAPR